MLKVFVVIVTYNGEKWICNCLGHLAESRAHVEVVVVDNDSTDRTIGLIQKNFPKTTIIRQNRNLGFGQANNIGIKYALARHADYLFLLNQDAYVYADTIGNLLSVHESHAEYGIISPLQLNGNGEQLDILFKKFISNSYSTEFAGSLKTGHPDWPGLLPVRFTNAAAWFISRACLEKVGLFSPLFYHYGEDNNYSSRVQYHGFRVGVCPLAAIRHDKIYALSAKDLLLRQIHLVPLCILLDLRKKGVITVLLVIWKFIGYGWKGAWQRSPRICKCTLDELKWISTNFRFIIRNRKESKIPFPNN